MLKFWLKVLKIYYHKIYEFYTWFIFFVKVADRWEQGKKTNLKTGVTRKQSMPHVPKNEHFLSPDTPTHVCVFGGKKCSFFGKLDVFCFLATPVLRFDLLPYYRRNVENAVLGWLHIDISPVTSINWLNAKVAIIKYLAKTLAFDWVNTIR